LASYPGVGLMPCEWANDWPIFMGCGWYLVNGQIVSKFPGLGGVMGMRYK